MKTHKINLAELVPHGSAETKLKGKTLDVKTSYSITDIMFNFRGNDKIKHYVSLPGKYRLPFRLDMKIAIDNPALILLVGGGHISFATPWQDNRKIDDIAFPSGRPNLDKNSFNNSLPLGETVSLSVSCNCGELQALVNGEERFYTCGLPYMNKRNRQEFDRLNTDGFEIGLAVFKLSTLNVKSITVTEFDDKAPITRGNFTEINSPFFKESEKPTFDGLVNGLPSKFMDEVKSMDEFLKSLNPLKFKRVIDKNGGKISYIASDFGISWAVNISGFESSQNFGWYIIYNSKPETWHKKADHMEELLAEINKSDSPLAQRIFFSLNDCCGCYPNCLAKATYAYNKQKRIACHGRVMFSMSHEHFNDAKEFFRYLNILMQRKITEGMPAPEKILLKKVC